MANSFIPKSIPTSLPVLGFLVISQSTVIDTKYWLAGFLDIVQERILPFSGIFLSITTLTQPIFSNLILSPSILNFWLGSLYDCVLPFFLNEGLPIFFPLFLEKYCFTVSLKSATFCWIAAADTSDSQGLSSIRSDFVGNFGLGFVSLSYELNESTQAFHTTRTHPNVFARSSSYVLFGYIRYLYERFIRLIINSF